MKKTLTLALFAATALFAKAQEVITLETGQQAEPLTVSAGDEATINEGQQTTLQATPTGGTSGYTYYWTPPTGLSSNLVEGPTASPTDTTVYTVQVRDSKNCTAYGKVTVNVIPKVSGTAENTLDKIAAYPNPVSDFFYIGLGSVEGMVTVRLLSMDGKEIWQETMDASGLEKAWFAAPGANGMYVLKLTSGGQTFTQTIAVTKQ